MASAAYSFERRGRSTQTLAILIAVYGVLVAAVIIIDAAWWLMAFLALFTLPAVRDLWVNPGAGVSLDEYHLEWHSGRRQGDLPLRLIDKMRFDTRWDFSVRVTAVLTEGKPIRLPWEALPPHREFEAELAARGVATERHHFTVF